MKKYLLLIATFLCFAPQAFAAFSYSIPVVIQPAQVSGLVATPVNFPVDVDVTQPTMRTIGNSGHVQSTNGYDIYFYSTPDCVTTRLPTERELYTASTGRYTGWVKTATLSTTTTTTIYACYGDASISTDPNLDGTYGATSVWDANFKTVYHLKDGSTLSLTDSTATGKTLTNNSTVTATTGQIDGSASFSGSNYLSASDSGLPTGAKTISMWVYPTAFSSQNNMLVYGTGGTLDKVVLWRFSGSGTSLDCAGWADDLSYAHTFSTNTMYKIDCAFNGTTATIYLNGAVVAGPTAKGWNTQLGEGLQLGNWQAFDPSNKFQGKMDEVRISNTARSADWLMTEYNNQSATSTFYTIGAEVPIGISTFFSRFIQTLGRITIDIGGLRLFIN